MLYNINVVHFMICKYLFGNAKYLWLPRCNTRTSVPGVVAMAGDKEKYSDNSM